MNDSILLTTRVEELERRVRDIDLELARLRGAGRSAASTVAPVAPPPRPQPQPALAVRVAPPTPPAAPPAAPPRPPREFKLPAVDPADLLGAKALAWAGGVVTALGVAFFFVLAVDRGWIGPELRVGFGAAASAAVVGVGLWLRGRFGETHSSLAAVGAGIAGGYVTLLAATVLYDLVPSLFALGLAVTIAAVALAIALAWSSEVLAGLGVVGAATMPGLVALQNDVTTVGTALALFMLVVAGVVGVREGWRALIVTAVAITVPQVLALQADATGHPAGVLAVAAAFWLFFLGVGIAADRWLESETGAFAVAFVVGSGAFAYVSASLLFGDLGRGIALGAAAGLTGVAALSASRTRVSGDLAMVLGAVALAEVAIAGANLLSGPSLAYAWAAEGAVLAVAAARTRMSSFHVAAIAYLSLASLHVLAFDAPPHDLFTAVEHPAAGAPVAAATALALFVLAVTLRVWKRKSTRREVLPAFRPLAVLADGVRANARELRVGAYLVGLLGLVYAGSLAVLALFQLGSDDTGTSVQTVTSR